MTVIYAKHFASCSRI